MRIPLPVKLMLSYLFIIAIGAGPTFIYVRAKLEADLMADMASMLVAHGKRIARTVGATTANAQVPQMQLLGETSVDRITYLSSRGDVLYDNELPSSGQLENRIGRPEVSYALGNYASPRADFASNVRGADGVGIAQRVSSSTGIETLYVAMQVLGPHGELIAVLRLATPVDRIGAMTSSMVRFARNIQAVAVSLAIGFSLLAAILFVRPLQRVGVMVNALASGDVGVSVGQLGNDEVGDVGRALDQMALSLRQKLLAAGLGEALLSQLVEALPTPCVVFEERGDVVAINGAARRSLCIEGPEAGKRMKDLAAQPLLQKALATAEDEGEPEPIVLPLAGDACVNGCMHVLKRPGMAPLRVFIGTDVPPPEKSLLPAPEEVRPRVLAVVIDQARNNAGLPPGYRLSIDLVPDVAQLVVADARDQLSQALAEAMSSAASAQSALRLDASVEPTAVRIHMNGAISEAATHRVRALINPLGGAVEVSQSETKLWLPRA